MLRALGRWRWGAAIVICAPWGCGGDDASSVSVSVDRLVAQAVSDGDTRVVSGSFTLAIVRPESGPDGDVAIASASFVPTSGITTDLDTFTIQEEVFVGAASQARLPATFSIVDDAPLPEPTWGHWCDDGGGIAIDLGGELSITVIDRASDHAEISGSGIVTAGVSITSRLPPETPNPVVKYLTQLSRDEAFRVKSLQVADDGTIWLTTAPIGITSSRPSKLAELIRLTPEGEFVSTTPLDAPSRVVLGSAGGYFLLEDDPGQNSDLTFTALDGENRPQWAASITGNPWVNLDAATHQGDHLIVTVWSDVGFTVGSSDEMLFGAYVLDFDASGNLARSAPLSGSFNGSLLPTEDGGLIVGGALYEGPIDRRSALGVVHRWDAEWSPVWTVQTPSTVLSLTATDATGLNVMTSSAIANVDPATGRIQWSWSSDSLLQSQAVDADGALLVVGIGSPLVFGDAFANDSLAPLDLLYRLVDGKLDAVVNAGCSSKLSYGLDGQLIAPIPRGPGAVWVRVEDKITVVDGGYQLPPSGQFSLAVLGL